MLGNGYGNQLRNALGFREGFDSIFGRESSHQQCQLTVGCHVDAMRIDPLHVFEGASTATVHFHNNLMTFMCVCSYPVRND